ncbi:MAG: anhydro-N-acetylmuramic acid kinase [Steroidobacteraceae bacterium]
MPSNTANATQLYVGLMSGTSMDGIDAVLLEIGAQGMQLRAAAQRDWPASLATRLRRAAEHPDHASLTEYGALDTAVALEFAQTVQQLLDATRTAAASIRAIGSHGQTLLHRPRAALPFTLQIGDPNVIAEKCGIDVVADFRRRDVAAGGEGAPLAPAFHQAAFGSRSETRAVLNLGGIANITLLRPDGTVLGFDTGPANCLMDSWIRSHLNQPYDRHGAWAAAGRVHETLLQQLLANAYFARPAPKSTGRDEFSDAWLAQALPRGGLEAADVQATLAELTARSVADALLGLPAPCASRLLICGGGAYNDHLVHRLQALLSGVILQSTADFGVAPEHVEAAAFAWLAHRHLQGGTANLPSVTGARHPVPLGALFPGRAAVTEP